jgi:hypothetical protein
MGMIEQNESFGRTMKRLRIALLISIPVLAFVVYLYFGVRRAREAANQTVCRATLGKLELALRNYHEMNGSFPPASIADENGKPMHSWRVLILPYLGYPEEYGRYRFDEPWNSPHNSKMERSAVAAFRCASRARHHDSPMTDYVLIVGKDTAFPGARMTTLADMQDGPENTILVAEINDSNIHWMEPRDLDAETMSFLVNDKSRPSISAPHPRGPAVAFADRIDTYRLSPTIGANTLRALTTIAGHEPIKKDKLVLENGQLGD